MKKELETALTTYIALKHTQDECVGFIDGFKAAEERMYSEEDMAESFIACWKANVPEGIECKLSFKEWFEQFKKK